MMSIQKVLTGSILLVLSLWTVAPAQAAYRWQVGSERIPELKALMGAHPQMFAGLSKDPQAQHIVVRVAESQAPAAVADILTAFQATADVKGEQWPLVLKPVRHSMADLRDIQRRLRRDDALMSSLQPILSQWSIDALDNSVKVGVTRLDERVAQRVDAVFSGAVRLVLRPRLQTFSRQIAAADGILSGGARIFRLGGAGCSSGFPVAMNESTLRGFTTAGHCALHRPLEMEFNDAGDTYLGQVLAFRWGFVESQGFGIRWEQETDSALVFDFAVADGAWPRPQVYTGDGNSDSRLYIHRYRRPELGEQVCFSGAVTGENCRAVVTNTDVSAVFYVDGGMGMMLTGLVEATAWDGSVLAQPGDSGGPVYIKENIGWNQVATGVGAIEGGPGPGPSSTAYFVPIDKVAPQGWQLVTADCSWFFGFYTCD